MYNCIITDIGMAKIANQVVTGAPLQLKQMALGDGKGSPVVPQQTATALVNEVYRGQINRLARAENDPAQIIAELVLLPDVGGFTVREVGVFDSAGDMIFYASSPPVYKPVLAEGTGMDYTVALRALVGNDVNVELKIDPGVVIATRKYVEDKIAEHDGDPNTHGSMLGEHNTDPGAHANVIAAHDQNAEAHAPAISKHNGDKDAHATAFAQHNGDANAHSSTEMPWINGGAATRTGNTTISLAGDQRSKYPIGKRLRFNGSDTYLCRVFGAPTYSGSVTAITVWFDVASAVIPASISKFERSRLTPQNTADSGLMIGSHDEATIQKLLDSYCCGSYAK